MNETLQTIPEPPKICNNETDPECIINFTEVWTLDTDKLMRFVQSVDTEKGICVTLDYFWDDMSGTLQIRNTKGEIATDLEDMAGIVHRGNFEVRWTDEGIKRWEKLDLDYPSLRYMTVDQLEQIANVPVIPDVQDYIYRICVQLALWRKKQLSE
jgi:hypothetical protein